MDTKTKELIEIGKMLPMMEEFYTIQGEGFYTGTAAYFVRIGGCDVGCHWCDVKESWNAELHPPTLVDSIVKNCENNSDTVVITGGEPLMWDLTYFTESLQERKIRTHIETSGAYPLTGVWDWICLSPKKTKLPLDEVAEKAQELKVIIYNNSDFKFAEEQAKRVSKDCRLYLQAEWSNREKMTPKIIDM